MHRHDQNMGRRRNEPDRQRDDERRGEATRGRDDDEWEERGYETRRRDDPSVRGQPLDEGRRFGGRGFFDRDREYLSRGGQGGYGGYGGYGERARESPGGREMSGRDRDRDEEVRSFDRGSDRPQDYGTSSIGFRDRMGQDYGYGGFGHMGQSDMYGERHMGGGHGMERYSDRYAHDRSYGMDRAAMRPGYGGMDRDYGYGGSDRGFGEPRATQGGLMRSQAPMRGKGPKNYTRSDERIREEVCELLQDADLDATEIEVKVEGGEVTLEGTVEDRWAKREAEDVVSQARGVKDCHNQLRVQSRDVQRTS